MTDPLREKILNRLQKRFGRYALPHLTEIIILGQVFFYFIALSRPDVRAMLLFEPHRFVQGEYWRLLSFPLYPPPIHWIWAFFAWYLFHLMGSALEAQWGTFRYNVYLFIACAMTVLGATLLALTGVPAPASGTMIATSIFLAFAWLFPDFQLYLFFVLPVKVKYLAWITAAGLFFHFVTGSVLDKVLVAASVANFILFFGGALMQRATGARRRMAREARRVAAEGQPFHRCAACGITERDDSEAEFRIASVDGEEYCLDHLPGRSPITPPPLPPPPESDGNSPTGGKKIH